MGYTTNTTMIQNNFGLLSHLRDSIKNGKDLSIKVEGESSLTRARVVLRSILAACEHYPEFAGGKFTGLGPAITISLDPAVHALVCARKAASSFVPFDSLTEVYAQAENTPDHTHLFTFQALDFDDESFTSRMAVLGWAVTLIEHTPPLNYSYHGMRLNDASQPTPTLDLSPSTTSPFSIISP